ncbi:MAG: preprotein translocase subunit SecG [Nitrospirota bacterium]
MYTLLTILHIIVCLIIISVILLQSGKGAELGASFGGSGQTIFGSRGPASFLSKLTVSAAIIFMITSLLLAIMSKERSVVSSIKANTTTESVPAASQDNSSSSETTETKPNESQPVQPDSEEK